MEAVAKAILMGVFGVIVVGLVRHHISEPTTRRITLYKGTIGSNTDGKWESIYTNK
jgi:hypothetical protein